MCQLNCSQIVLIPKNGSPTRIGEFRPIGLLNGIFKILYKVLASRLTPHMPSLEEEYQTTFKVRRSIMEGIAIVYEVIHHNKKSGRLGFLLKLDFEKIYDMIDLRCLQKVLIQRDFSPKWLQWIK